jgi:two-component system chemotaxis sensor kinase CheA
MVSLDQFKQTFITESYELLKEMEERVLGLNVEAADSEALNAIFRCAHSIKGSAGAFGLDYITNFTHILEALLDVLREGKVHLTRDMVDTLLLASDIVTQMMRCAEKNTLPADNFGCEVRKKLEFYVSEQPHVAPVVLDQSEFITINESMDKRWNIDFVPHDNLFYSGNEPLLLLRELKRLGDAEINTVVQRVPAFSNLDATHCYLAWNIVLNSTCAEDNIRGVFEFVNDICDLRVEQMKCQTEEDISLEINERQSGLIEVQTEVSESRDAQSIAQTVGQVATEESAQKIPQVTSIRVDIEKVDRLVNMVGELVITEAMLRAQTRDIAVEQFSGIIRGIDELSQHTRELQEAVMSMRMQPVKSIFSRMPRIVRDISAKLEKEIQLETFGENTEVDKTVIEQLADPLMHMIRNSCDHGIETPAVRVQNKKPHNGTIRLSAEHRGGRIVIEVRDDGAGINRARVLQKAKEKNLVPADAVLSNDEIDNMIFGAGFSTAEKVTSVSGRGVGMDVVKRNIESMGGTVRVNNEPGQGTIFTVSLPLTLAILDGMIVRVGHENYIIPITSIIETLRPRPVDVHHVDGHSDVINVRGEFVPVIYLYKIFGIQDAQSDPSKALVVLVESNHKKMGVVVDELIGQQQVVIKSLEANADPVQAISGATILGDGRVSLILEINDLGKISQSEPHPVALARAV